MTRTSYIRARVAFAILVAMPSLSHCRDVMEPSQPASISVNPDHPTIVVGGTVQLVAIVKDAAGHDVPNRPIAWTSSNTLVANVSPNGLATGMGEGSAT